MTCSKFITVFRNILVVISAWFWYDSCSEVDSGEELSYLGVLWQFSVIPCKYVVSTLN
jgi:hypothetical protein